MGDVLALAMCFSHGGLAHGCYIEYGYVALPWLLPYKVIMALGACTWTTWPGQRVQSSYFGLGYLPWEHEDGFFFFFFLKGGHLGRPSCLGLGSMPTGAVLAFVSCLWELP